jgi:RNA polymerase sigma-70 factor (ECF subfamily)
VANAFDDRVRDRPGRRGTIGVAYSVQSLECPHERVVHSPATLTSSQVRTRAPASDASRLAVGELREPLARLGAPAEEHTLDHAHVRLDALVGQSDSHRTITAVEGEHELVERAAAGDVEAFAELVRAYERRVAAVLYRLLDDQRDVEEATQDVFVQAWRNLHSFRGGAQLFTWLYRIAVNEALMRTRRKRLDVRELDDRVAAPPEPEPGVRDMLLRELAALPFDYRAAVVLRDVEGLTNAEVAQALGISVPAAKSRIHRGRMQIREGLERWEAG